MVGFSEMGSSVMLQVSSELTGLARNTTKLLLSVENNLLDISAWEEVFSFRFIFSAILNVVIMVTIISGV